MTDGLYLVSFPDSPECRTRHPENASRILQRNDRREPLFRPISRYGISNALVILHPRTLPHTCSPMSLQSYLKLKPQHLSDWPSAS